MGGVLPDIAAGGVPSDATTMIVRNDAVSRSKGARSAARGSEIATASARLSDSTCAMVSAVSRVLTGTGITPARSAPQNTMGKSTVSCNSITRRRSRPIPAAASAPAKRRVPSASAARVRDRQGSSNATEADSPSRRWRSTNQSTALAMPCVSPVSRRDRQSGAPSFRRPILQAPHPSGAPSFRPPSFRHRRPDPSRRVSEPWPARPAGRNRCARRPDRRSAARSRAGRNAPAPSHGNSP